MAGGGGSRSRGSRRARARRKQGGLRCSCSPAPDDDPAAEAEAPVLHILDPGGAPELELARERIAAPELADTAAEEAADLVPGGRDDSSRRRKHDADDGAAFPTE